MAEPQPRFGYCTNVHAGTSIEEAKANLLRYASDVRSAHCPEHDLPLGLWLSENAAMGLIDGQQVQDFGNWLAEHHFRPYTFNGFPQGDFHQPIVKHAVYEPTWCCQSRARYTTCLAEILAAILPEGATGSISTLPLGWPHAPWHAENFKDAADNLLQVAKALHRIHQEHGRDIILAIEPEPGCVLNTAEEIVDFFEHFLFSGPDANLARRYIGVCHDICHSSVMFEPQVEALELYRQAGVRIGKVQVSSAVHVPWDQVVGDAALQATLLQQLGTFDEPKYLHQTTRCTPKGELLELAEDLNLALSQWIDASLLPTQPWRIHFHVPIFVNQFGALATSQSDIHEATRYLELHANYPCNDAPWFTGHYEVETYAWPVLPDSLAESQLSSGIARELAYFDTVLLEAAPPKA